MIEIRRVRREEFPEAVRLADQVFRGDGGRSMGPTYPTVFSPAYGQSFGAFEEGRMVAFIGLVPNVVRIGPAALRTYSVGGVCTDERYRGRGIAASILDRILEHLSDARVPLLLVSGGRSLYTRIGCREFGTMHRFELNASDAERLSPATGDAPTIRPMSPADWFGLRDAALAKEVRYEQSLWDLATLIDAQVPASNSGLMNRILVAESRATGAILGFLVYGGSPEGSAPQDAVAVEWAGDAETVAALLAEAVRR
ncbi:MAG TPA: GNAT family N-acetyltransferase, partial [Paenibacillus sp.]|nr:GNAT family N-acetyltransferase [Paenibacillus sp.]